MSAITSTFRRLSPPVLSPITSSTVGHHLHRARSPVRVTRAVIVAYRLRQLLPAILIASASARSASPPSRASARSDSSPRWEATTPAGVGYRLHPGAVGWGERLGQSHRTRRMIRVPGTPRRVHPTVSAIASGGGELQTSDLVRPSGARPHSNDGPPAAPPRPALPKDALRRDTQVDSSSSSACSAISTPSLCRRFDAFWSRTKSLVGKTVYTTSSTRLDPSAMTSEVW